jgi:hypothetical protein
MPRAVARAIKTHPCQWCQVHSRGIDEGIVDCKVTTTGAFLVKYVLLWD